MLKTGPKTIVSSKINSAQKDKIKTWYINPLMEMVYDALDNISDINQRDNIFRKLIALIIQSEPQDNKRRQLSIVEGMVDKDIDLEKEIGKILPAASRNQIKEIYDPLFKLMHEYRFNKNPDDIDAEAKNAQFAATLRGADLYARTITEFKTLSHRIQQEGNGYLATSAEIENVVLEIISEVRNEIAPKQKEEEAHQELKTRTDEISSTTSSGKNSDKPLLNAFERNREHSSLLNQSALLIQEDPELEFAIYASLETYENEKGKQIEDDTVYAKQVARLEADEAYARKLLQEQQDEEYARQLESEANTNDTSTRRRAGL